MERTITAVFKRGQNTDKVDVTHSTLKYLDDLHNKGFVLTGFEYGYDENANHCRNCNKYIPSGWQTLCKLCFADLNYKN